MDEGGFLRKVAIERFDTALTVGILGVIDSQTYDSYLQ